MRLSPQAPTIEAIRERFPALRSPMALLENAGGSQVPLEVADAIRAYMLTNYVQLGAGYPMSDVATRTVDAAHEVVNTIFGGTRTGKAILGGSSTQLIHVVAGCAANNIKPGDEIVIAETGHEANIGPWLRLERAGAVIRWWKVCPDAQDCPIDALGALLSSRTRWVIFPHVSNLLGAIVDVQAVTRMAHAAGARVFVDGVALAPHRAMDVERWGVDWYVYSTYKVYGPHMGAMYGRADAIAELEGPNHFFIPRDQVPYKFELGGACHEGCAAIVALAGYLRFLAGGGEGAPDISQPAAGLARPEVDAAFARMTALELPLQAQLVQGIAANPALRLVGPATVGENDRVPTVSFVHRSMRPSQVVARAHAAGAAIRCGHMYAYRLCQALGIDTAEGVVRASAVHYNTPAEVTKLLESLV